ncbi:MAG: icmD [Gammaproteobacteria bacterium]|jgi:intracellular multiplication protein IcmD|nr:icmD [Gammaproteobacteria bacterium]
MINIYSRIAKFFLGFILVSFVGISYAQETSATDISSLVNNIQLDVVKPIFNVIISIAYLAGAGFVVAAIFKFKAHKDNPTQVTVGTPIMLLFVGIGLLFLPAIVTSVMNSIGFTSSGAGSVDYTKGSITG